MGRLVDLHRVSGKEYILVYNEVIDLTDDTSKNSFCELQGYIEFPGPMPHPRTLNFLHDLCCQEVRSRSSVVGVGSSIFIDFPAKYTSNFPRRHPC